MSPEEFGAQLEKIAISSLTPLELIMDGEAWTLEAKELVWSSLARACLHKQAACKMLREIGDV